MESVGSQGSCTGAPRLLLVPSPIHPDLQVDLDEEDEDIVIGIRPKSSPQPRRKTSINEEESDLSEPPSLSGSRRVSFADTVGLSLVQVREFDKWDVPLLPDFLDLTSQDEDEYFISTSNFLTPLPSDEMIVKLLDEKVVLQSLELIPRTTILKGLINVLNISFTKAVYVRTSLDDWLSHFDLLSEFVPGSSDGHLDTFSFRLKLVPPFAEQGTKVHFCLRYETQNRTFWANNGGKNYVLFCQERKKEVPDQTQLESKKSCLKAVSQSFSLDNRASSLEPEKSAADETTQQNTIHERENTIHEREANPSNNSTEDSVQENRRNRSCRNRRKAVHVARIKDYFAQKNVTGQHNESQASPETQTPAAEEQNQTMEKLNLEGSVPFADDALGSDSMTRENLDLADDVDGVESKDVPIEACSCVKASSGVSTQKDPGERLVSFAFGTVLAPLYQEVSGRAVGGQLYSETKCKHMKNQQEIENDTMNVRHACIGRSCDDRNDERTNKVDNAVEMIISPTLGLPEVLCSTGSVIVDSKKEDSSSEHRETIVTQTPQTRLIENENFDENRDETVLEMEEQDCLSIKLDDLDDPSLEYSKNNVAIPQSPILFQEELATFSVQLSRKDILQSSFNVPSGTGLECVDKSLNKSRKVQYDKSLSPSCKYLLHQDLVVPAFSTIPSLDTESCSAFTSPVHRVEICEETLYSNHQISKNVDVAFLTRNAIDKTSQEFENQTMLVNSKHSSKPPKEDKHVSATNTSKFKNEPSQDNEVKNVNVSSIYEEDNPLITLPLRPSVETPEKDLFLLLDQNNSLLEKLKHRCKLTGELNPDNECPQTTLSTNPLLLEHNDDSKNSATMSQNVEEKTCLLERNSPYCQGNFTEEIYYCEAGSVDITLNIVSEENTNVSLEESESDKITQPGELNLENDSNMLPIFGGESLTQKECFLDNPNLGLDCILSEMDLLPCPESCMEENESFLQDYNLSSVGLVAAPLDTVSLSAESGREQDLTDFISNANSESTGYEIIANCFEKLEDIQSVNIEKHETSTDEVWEASVQSEDVVESKTKNDCVFASENEEHSKTLSLTETGDLSLEDGVIERLDSETALSVDFKNTAEDLETLVAPEVYSQPFFKETYPSGSNEKNIAVCASVASIECRILDSMNNPPQYECDDRERETIKRPLKTRDEERFKIPPRQAKRKFSASIAKSIPSQDDTVEAGSCMPTEMDQTLDLGSSKDANGNTFSCMELQNESLTDNSSGSKRPHEHILSGIYVAPCESNMEEHSSLSQIYESSSVGLVDIQSDTSSPLDESGLEQDFPETAVILEREEKIYNLRSESKGHDITDYENLEVEQDCVENQDQQMSNDEEMKTSNQCFANVVESKTSFYVDHLVRLEIQIEASLEDGAKDLKKDNEIEELDILSTHVEEKELDGCKKGRIMDSNDSMPKYKLSDIVEDIEIIQPTSKGDRFKVPPRKVKRELQAQTVLKSPLSVQDEIGVKCCMPIEINAKDSTFSDYLDYDKNTDDESNSESESGSEDEMELYMHCLRAVYGQQRWTKATKPEQKRLPSTRTKRSTSLASISEALDEEQTDINHRHEDKSPVQTIAATLPKEEDDDHCLKKMFSYRKVLKSLLFVTFAVIFLAVSYHYDFIACFGLYLLSLIWLFFQGDKQNRKHNRGM